MHSQISCMWYKLLFSEGVYHWYIGCCIIWSNLLPNMMTLILTLHFKDSENLVTFLLFWALNSAGPSERSKQRSESFALLYNVEYNTSKEFHWYQLPSSQSITLHTHTLAWPRLLIHYVNLTTCRIHNITVSLVASAMSWDIIKKGLARRGYILDWLSIQLGGWVDGLRVSLGTTLLKLGISGREHSTDAKEWNWLQWFALFEV